MLAMAEPGDEHAAPFGKADACQRCMRGFTQGVLAARRLPEMKGVTGMRLHGECHVVEDGEIREQRCDLERAGKTELAAAGRSMCSCPHHLVR